MLIFNNNNTKKRECGVFFDEENTNASITSLKLLRRFLIREKGTKNTMNMA